MNVAESKSEEVAIGSVLAGLAAMAAGFVVWQAASARAFELAGLTVDRLSAVLTLLVGVVGLVTYRFSLRYLDGEPQKRRFLRVQCLTVCAAYALMLSTNLLMLFAMWTLTSAGLHLLLTFYSDRPEAQAPARKKFVISRVGDLALIAAIFLIWREYRTFDLHVFFERMDHSSAVPDSVAVLVAVAALTKSAQFPFHSWLPETMESPTPVSALMHAGIINAGGAMLIRFSPLISRSAPAILLLVGVGTVTAVLGMLCMWAQVKVKRTLAWSTVSQMGFMMVQCGLCVFPAAALHILGHGFYKAWSFLRAGGLPSLAASAEPVTAAWSLTVAATGTLAAIPALLLAAMITRFSPLESPGEMALSGIVALSIGQLWVVLLRPMRKDSPSVGFRVALAIGLTLLVALLAFSLYAGSQAFFLPVLGHLEIAHGGAAWVTAAFPVIALLTLIVLHAALPVLGRTAWGRALRVHALHGFYFGAIADRLIESIWKNFSREEISHA